MLRQPSDHQHDAAVRWRQLVDLIARAGPGVDSAAVGEALDVIARDSTRIDERLRAAAARAIAGLPLPMGLLEYFVTDRLGVSAPILAAASLEPEHWRAMLGKADEETRRFVETLHPELSAARAPGDESNSPSADESAGRSIGAMVARIERRRRSRAVVQGPSESAEGPAMFRWECGPSGEIGWVEGAPRGTLIGRSIARTAEGQESAVDPSIARAFEIRAPFRDAAVTFAGSGVLTGKWRFSGVPAFEPANGRFAGYRGIGLRESARMEEAHAPTAAATGQSESLRELVHELKTPLNAIVGFAEIIDGQYLGPAGKRYRNRAGDIVAKARLLLSAIDDLDLAARSVHGAARCDLRETLAQLVDPLRHLADARGVELVLEDARMPVMARIDREFCARMIERLLRAAIDLADPQQRVAVQLSSIGGNARVSITRPRRLRDEDLALDAIAESDFSDGFSMKLAKGLARIAGGSVTITQSAIQLDFPKA